MRERGLFGLRKRQLWGRPNSSLPVPGGGRQVLGRQSPPHHSDRWRKGKRQEPSFEVREVLTGYKEDHLYHEDNWADEAGCPDSLRPLQPQVYSR